jgi:hypothetical protein
MCPFPHSAIFFKDFYHVDSCFFIVLLKLKELGGCQWLMPCNPSYSEGRDQNDCSSKPAWANSLQDLISKKQKTSKTPSQ